MTTFFWILGSIGLLIFIVHFIMIMKWVFGDIDLAKIFPNKYVAALFVIPIFGLFCMIVATFIARLQEDFK